MILSQSTSSLVFRILQPSLMLHSVTPLFVRKITGKWQKTRQRSIAPNLVLTLYHIIVTLEVNQPIWKIIVATLCNQFWRVCHFVLVRLVLANRLFHSLFYSPSPQETYIYRVIFFPKMTYSAFGHCTSMGLKRNRNYFCLSSEGHDPYRSCCIIKSQHKSNSRVAAFWGVKIVD